MDCGAKINNLFSFNDVDGGSVDLVVTEMGGATEMAELILRHPNMTKKNITLTQS